jgi:hypothetical protein
MGDKNAVTMIQEAHRRKLISAGVLRPEELLMPGNPFPSGRILGDVCIDDLALLFICHYFRLSSDEDARRLRAAEQMYDLCRIRSRRTKPSKLQVRHSCGGRSFMGRSGLWDSRCHAVYRS